MPQPHITTIFTDIGGVLLTNGWDHTSRQKACDVFKLDRAEVDERHHLTFDTYEEGKLNLEEYLTRVIFYKAQPFSRQDFIDFMYAQSQPYAEMIDLLSALKQKYSLKIAAVSNEGRELTMHRIAKFNLSAFIDFFVSSCFVHIRKPDHDIWRMAIDISQSAPDQVVYIEDRFLFVEEARRMGLVGLKHTTVAETKTELEKYGLKL